MVELLWIISFSASKTEETEMAIKIVRDCDGRILAKKLLDTL